MREGDGRLHIGYIGSIGYLKGLHVLIDAVNALPPESVTLTIYGGLSDFPDYVRDLQQRASHPGITFAGVVARDDLWPAMADFDVVVLPTLWYEVSPLVIDEVFAMGIPIVASNIGAMAEKIRDGENGRLFPPGDVAALTAILDDLQHHPGQLAEWADGMPAVQSVAAHMKAIEEVYAAALVSV
jgi:glycosyltransferase involved in cell wall biosynthesis